MTNINRLLIPILVTMVTFSSVQGQETNKNTLYSDNTAEIVSSIEDCIDKANGTAKQYILLQLENKTTTPIRISFKKEVWYANKCSNCDTNNPEFLTHIEIPPNQTLSGGCGTENRSLRIFSKMLKLKNVRKLSHFELKSIEVETVD